MNAKSNFYGRTGQSHKRWYRRTPEILLEREIEPLLHHAMAESLRDYMLIFFTLNTGLRNTEVVGLNVENIEPFGEITKILELPALIAKGNKPRSIPLNRDVIDKLSIYLLEQKSQGKINGGETPLFRSKFSNKRLCPRCFQQILRRHSLISIKRPVYPHILRHTFATKLLGQSNIKIVQEILGHTCLQSTQIYLHPSSEEKIDAVNKLHF